MNLIYQFYNGQIPDYARAGSKIMKAYADKIGADYTVDFNKTTIASSNSSYHNCFRPVFDASLDKYDKILFCDMDIFPVKDIDEDIFDQQIDKFGIVEEKHQPEIRYADNNNPISGKNDERWSNIVKSYYGIKLPRDNQNRLRVFNSGVVLYTREGINLARSHWIPISQYESAVASLHRFYHLDQNYLGAMLGQNTFTVMDSKWNSQIHFIGDKNKKPRDIFDSRTQQTNFVHIQLRGRDKLDDDRIYDIVNKPISEWRHERV